VSRDPLLYLDDIYEAMEMIGDYTEGMAREEFLRNRLVQDAVIRRIEIIGEAAARLPEGIKNQYSEIPWQDIVGMRNHIVHAYFGLLLDRVWNVVQQDLPSLKLKIEDMRRTLG
jgi:uncharacterized protein with HEPN domain